MSKYQQLLVMNILLERIEEKNSWGKNQLKRMILSILSDVVDEQDVLNILGRKEKTGKKEMERSGIS